MSRKTRIVLVFRYCTDILASLTGHHVPVVLWSRRFAITGIYSKTKTWICREDFGGPSFSAGRVIWFTIYPHLGGPHLTFQMLLWMLSVAPRKCSKIQGGCTWPPMTSEGLPKAALPIWQKNQVPLWKAFQCTQKLHMAFWHLSTYCQISGHVWKWSEAPQIDFNIYRFGICGEVKEWIPRHEGKLYWWISRYKVLISLIKNTWSKMKQQWVHKRAKPTCENLEEALENFSKFMLFIPI